MNDDRNRSQIIRIDARNCFVESLNDAFEIGKAHSLHLPPTTLASPPASVRPTAFKSTSIWQRCWSCAGSWWVVNCAI